MAPIERLGFVTDCLKSHGVCGFGTFFFKGGIFEVLSDSCDALIVAPPFLPLQLLHYLP